MLLREISACTHCAGSLPLGPRPVVRAGRSASLLIIGQAPGTKVHETGIPWNDPSGDRLRSWTGLPAPTFYDPDLVAIMPMGFCYPGRLAARRRQPTPAGMRAAVAPQAESAASRREADLAGRPICAESLPEGLRPRIDDRDGPIVRRLSAGFLPVAAPELADHRLDQAQSLVRGRDLAGATPASKRCPRSLLTPTPSAPPASASRRRTCPCT